MGLALAEATAAKVLRNALRDINVIISEEKHKFETVLYDYGFDIFEKGNVVPAVDFAN